MQNLEGDKRLAVLSVGRAGVTGVLGPAYGRPAVGSWIVLRFISRDTARATLQQFFSGLQQKEGREGGWDLLRDPQGALYFVWQKIVHASAHINGVSNTTPLPSEVLLGMMVRKDG